MDKHYFASISMNGRMAYIIMCVEKYLVTVFPEKDWTCISRALWKATSENWADWADMYSAFIPDVFLEYDNFHKDLSSSMNMAEYEHIKSLYKGITSGESENPSDIVNILLNIPFDMAMIYEGSSIGDGSKANELISKAESILVEKKISLPDQNKIAFSSFNERNGWGNDFAGEFLSIILNG